MSKTLKLATTWYQKYLTISIKEKLNNEHGSHDTFPVWSFISSGHGSIILKHK